MLSTLLSGAGGKKKAKEIPTFREQLQMSEEKKTPNTKYSTYISFKYKLSVNKINIYKHSTYIYT